LADLRTITTTAAHTGLTIARRIFRGARHVLRRPALPFHGAMPAIERPSVVLATGLVAALAAIKIFDPLMRHRPVPTPGGFVFGVLEFFTSFGEGVELLVGSGVLVIALAVLGGLALPRALKPRLFEAAATFGFVFVSVAGSGILAALAKNLFGRARPEHLVGDAVFQIHDAVFASKWAAFPSGHATTAGASAVVLALLFPRIRRLALGLGVAIALTRIGLGAHFPSDVIAGFALGAAFTLVCAHGLATRGLVFLHDLDGNLAPRPDTGPAGWFDLLEDLLAALRPQSR
jgi:membrane-associated phospholipid phosphatase